MMIKLVDIEKAVNDSPPASRFTSFKGELIDIKEMNMEDGLLHLNASVEVLVPILPHLEGIPGETGLSAEVIKRG